MTFRFATYAVLLTLTLTMSAQTEPVLNSASIPKYPPLARQARIEGTVNVSFTLPGNSAEPTNVEATSGHPAFKEAAAENVKTWRFSNPYAVDRKYATTIEYRISDGGAERVTFESFHKVEIVTYAHPHTVTY